MNTSSMFRRPAKLLAVGGLLFAALLAGQSALAATIIGSKHDLTSAGSVAATIGTAISAPEPCAFCHTPHGASASAQLWNRGAAATGTFGLYISTTMNTAAVQPSANSILCLSCHDGATALDLIINKPGSGGLIAAGGSAGYAYGVGKTTTGMMLSTSAANMGVSLANDHPIGVPYCGGATGGVCADADFKIAALYLNTTVTAPATTAATGTGWWIDTGTAGMGAGSTRDKSDLPLYQVGAVIPRVECATCHEPHNATAVAGATSFLRIANTGSAMCVACHNK